MAHTYHCPQLHVPHIPFFRFSYYPGADSAGFSTGNNFYLDNFNFSQFPESVKNIDRLEHGISLLPNPTQGNTVVVIKDNATIGVVDIIVTDVAGNPVYKTSSSANLNTASIEIPENIIKIKGLYLVHVITGRINQTSKLVVY